MPVGVEDDWCRSPPISFFSITRLSATDNANSALVGFLARFTSQRNSPAFNHVYCVSTGYNELFGGARARFFLFEQAKVS